MDIKGTWYNELNSTLKIKKVKDGNLTGTYETAVSNEGCAQGSFKVAGRTDTDNGGYAVAFVICWQNDESDCESVTAWSGQAQVIDGEETLTAMWLLTSETPPDKNWTSTLVGKDVFTRNPPDVDRNKGPKVFLKSNP